MQSSKNTQIAIDIRVYQIVRMCKRLLGARFLTIEDFLPNISPDEGQILAALARTARGSINSHIIVLGVMPRSGTNFVRDLLAMHPNVTADPGRLYEFPLLHAADDAAAFTRDFLKYFPRNEEVLGRYDILAMLAGTWLRELQTQAAGKHILLKCPHVHNLSLAQHIFPDAKIILCLRDGRDVLDSTQKTFAKTSLYRKNFRQIADEWRLAAEAIMTFSEGGLNENQNTMIVRYEDIIADQFEWVRKMLNHSGLDEVNYPWDEVDRMPVRGSSRSKAALKNRWMPEAKHPNFNSVRRWASWSDSRKLRFDKLAGSALELAGYER